jgi:transposase
MLDWVPARLRVLRIRRPKYGCRACGTIHQAPAPERPITKGLATPGLIAQVLVSKDCDHTPLYRWDNRAAAGPLEAGTGAGGEGRTVL